MATFSEFVNSLTTDQVNDWWTNIAPEKAPDKDENQNWKYWIAKDSKSLPFRYCMKALSEKYAIEIDDSISNDNNRVTFCNKFGMELVEKLVYDKTEEKIFRDHYKTKVKNHNLFQSFITYTNSVVVNLGIKPSQMRTAIDGNNQILIIIGMRNVLTYKEKDGKSFISFIISEDKFQAFKQVVGTHSVHEFQGQGKSLLVELEVKVWDLLPPDFLTANKDEIQKNYTQVKTSKLVRWNADAKTSSSVVKFLIFNNANINEWMAIEKSEYTKEYFDFEGMSQYANMVGQTYDAENSSANWFYDTRDKLYYLVELLNKKYNKNYSVVYREAPNGQAGRAKILFKDYVLAGFSPVDRSLGDDLFMKFCIQNLKKAPVFSLELDVNFKKKTGIFINQREAIYNDHMTTWTIDDDFPKSWDSLLSLVDDEVLTLEKDYLSYYNQTLKNTMAIQDKKAGLNQIFFGPPGTGKTYSAIPESIKIANPTFVFPDEPHSEEGRKAIKLEFERLQNQNKIALTTFHQSLSYEDFIEGIKPALNRDDIQSEDSDGKEVIPTEKEVKLEYILKAGIFKNSCAAAAYLCHEKSLKESQTNSGYTFDELYVAFIFDIIAKIKNNDNPLYTSLKGKQVKVMRVNNNMSIYARAKDSIAKKSAPLTLENMQKLYDRFKTIEEITNLKQVEETVQVTPRITEFYAVFKGLKEFEATFAKTRTMLDEESINTETINLEEAIKKFESGVYTDSVMKYGNSADPVVLIIDEINRGNIASIFGELITLIEPDKRWGADERLMLKLPYSQSDFFVPVNLYIIGTMNTADRSVESLDTALRRRFEFKPYLPQHVTLNDTEDGIELSKLLKSLNERLTILKDKDHLIGHAWLWNIKNTEGLQKIFANKIIPLLQEYFYNDYEKLGLLLGKAFFEPPLKVNTSSFASFYNSGGLKNQYQNRVIYSLKDPYQIQKEDFMALYDSKELVAEEDVE